MQVIVSDDCSTDRTFDVVNECVEGYEGPHDVVARRNDSNLGMAAHVNVLLAQTKGAFVCWAAGDDVSLPGKIEALITPMVEDSTVSGTHSFLNEIDADGNYLQERRPAVPARINSAEEVIRDELEVISQSHAFRKSIWEKFGPLHESVTNEGAVMAFREAYDGAILLVPEILTNYRVGVGVSTQRGKTVMDLAISEPVKYARWWASGYRQILRDIEIVGAPSALENAVTVKLEHFEARLRVNERSWQVAVVGRHVFRRGFSALLMSFIRRNTPQAILNRIYRARGWL